MRDKPLKCINLFAGSGAGKSTTAASVYSILKLHGCPVELVTEFAKDLTWEERNKTLKNQLYIFAKQYHRLFRLDSGVDLAITDSPLPLSVYYQSERSETFINEVMNRFSEFENINFFVNRVKPYWECGRRQPETIARQDDVCIKECLASLNIKYEIINGDENGINDISRFILDKYYKKEQMFFVSKKQDKNCLNISEDLLKTINVLS